MPDDLFHLRVGQRLSLSESSPTSVVIERFAGGFGEVYVLRDDNTGELVAAKTPRLAFSGSSEILRQFAREAAIWTTLPRHANILQAYDIRSHNQQPFVRMRHIPRWNNRGSSLEAIFDEQAPGNRTCGGANFVSMVTAQLFDVLGFLEREVPGFVHGDIKPSNLLILTVHDDALGEVPVVQLSDFGLTWAAAMAKLGRPLYGGDLAYLAPEVFDGHVGEKAQDMYAVGCTLFRLTFGLPYQALTSDGGIARLAGVGIDRMRSYRPDLPVLLFELLLECLSDEPARRPSSFDTLRVRYQAAVIAAGGNNYHGTVRDTPPSWMPDVNESPLVNYLQTRHGLSHDDATAIAMSLTDANGFVNLGLPESSEIIIASILDKIPNLAPALAGRAYRLTHQQQFDAARNVYEEALAAYRGDRELLAVDQLGYASACASLAQIIVAGPYKDPQLIVAGARLAEEAVRLLPTSAKAHMTVGMARLRMRDFEAASSALLKAHDLDPSNRKIQLYWAAVDVASAGGSAAAFQACGVRLGLTHDESKWLKRFLEYHSLC